MRRHIRKYAFRRFSRNEWLNGRPLIPVSKICCFVNRQQVEYKEVFDTSWKGAYEGLATADEALWKALWNDMARDVCG